MSEVDAVPQKTKESINNNDTVPHCTSIEKNALEDKVSITPDQCLLDTAVLTATHDLVYKQQDKPEPHISDNSIAQSEGSPPVYGSYENLSAAKVCEACTFKGGQIFALVRILHTIHGNPLRDKKKDASPKLRVASSVRKSIFKSSSFQTNMRSGR